MELLKKTALLVGAMATCTVGGLGVANATNGMMANGYGGEAKGMAGAGVTSTSGVLAEANNPALAAKVGNAAGLCFTQFMPHRDVDIGTGAMPAGEYNSKKEWFPILCGGANYMVQPETSVGLAIYANGGMNTYYSNNMFAAIDQSRTSTSPVGVDLAQVFFAANVAHKFTDELSIGAAPVLAVQRFKAEGLQAFKSMSENPEFVSNTGYNWAHGIGAKIGVNYDVNAYLSLGAAYQSKMFMTKLEKYKGLFAEGGRFDIPAIATAGVGIHPVKSVDVLLEYQRIFYGDVKAISNDGAALTTRLGADNGPGFGWKDQDVFHVGVQWRATPELTLRTGYSHASQVIPDSQVMFNILAPATPQDHASVGLTYKFADGYAFTFAYTHAFAKKVSGRTPALMGSQPVSLEMDQDEIVTGLSVKF